MKKIVLASLVLAASLTAAGAQEAYSPGDRQTLVQSPLPGMEGQQMTIERVTFPGAWTGERHTHGGPVYVYVLDGSFRVDVDGAEPAMLQPGEIMEEPPEVPMVAINASESDPVTILLIQISAEGEPLMRPVE